MPGHAKTGQASSIMSACLPQGHSPVQVEHKRSWLTHSPLLLVGQDEKDVVILQAGRQAGRPAAGGYGAGAGIGVWDTAATAAAPSLNEGAAVNSRLCPRHAPTARERPPPPLLVAATGAPAWHGC